MEHRWGKRVTTHIPVRLVASGGALGAGRVRDLSVSGAFVETSLPLRPLSWIQLEAQRAAAGRRVRIAACVVRCTPTGVGIEWCDGSRASVEELFRAICGVPALEPAMLNDEAAHTPMPARVAQQSPASSR